MNDFCARKFRERRRAKIHFEWLEWGNERKAEINMKIQSNGSVCWAHAIAIGMLIAECTILHFLSAYFSSEMPFKVNNNSVEECIFRPSKGKDSPRKYAMRLRAVVVPIFLLETPFQFYTLPETSVFFFVSALIIATMGESRKWALKMHNRKSVDVFRDKMPTARWKSAAHTKSNMNLIRK